MINKRLFGISTVALIAVFVVATFSTVNVLADDATPPSAATEEPVSTEEPLATVEPVATEEPATTDASIDLDTPAEILSSIPQGMDVVVLNQNGEPEALASSQAAEIISASDPMWCPTGQTPGDAGCTIGYTDVTTLIANLGSKSGAGTIYFTSTYSTNDAALDHGNANLAALTDLTIQGGWNGSTGGGFALSGNTTFSGAPLSITNWAGNVTANNIFIDSSAVDGLTISTTGSVELNQVSVQGAAGNGIVVGADGDVTVDHVVANGNGTDGLDVLSEGDITLNHVTANGNGVNGAYLDNSCGCLFSNIFISSSNFNDNGANSEGRGLIAHAVGDIKLTNVNANGNGGGGAELDNELLGDGIGSITLIGKNTFNDNGGDLFLSVGLYAVSTSDITLHGVTANGNGWGAGGGAFVASDAGNIFITNSKFNNNCTYCEASFGLVVFGSGDSVTLNSVTANGNGNDPDNGYTGSAVGLGAIIFNMGGNVFVTNSNFSNNCTLGDCGGTGIATLAFGNVLFNHVTANNNGTDLSTASFLPQDGGLIQSLGNIGVLCSTFKNNKEHGLDLDGNVTTLNGVIFGGNTLGDFDSFGPVSINPGDCDPGGGKKTDSPSLPINVVDVVGGEDTELDCNQYRGTLLILPNGDSSLFPCPISKNASLAPITKDNLPGVLDGKFTFVSAMNPAVTPSLNGMITIYFNIPADQQNASLTILHWDGTKWEELDGFVNADGKFEASSGSDGVFILATK